MRPLRIVFALGLTSGITTAAFAQADPTITMKTAVSLSVVATLAGAIAGAAGGWFTLWRNQVVLQTELKLETALLRQEIVNIRETLERLEKEN